MKMNRTIIAANNSFNICMYVPRKIRSKLQFIILKDFFFSFQEYSVQITFRQQWNDNRLAFNNMDGEYYISRSPQHECTKLHFDKISFNDNLVTVLTIQTIPSRHVGKLVQEIYLAQCRVLRTLIQRLKYFGQIFHILKLESFSVLFSIDIVVLVHQQ